MKFSAFLDVPVSYDFEEYPCLVLNHWIKISVGALTYWCDLVSTIWVEHQTTIRTFEWQLTPACFHPFHLSNVYLSMVVSCSSSPNSIDTMIWAPNLKGLLTVLFAFFTLMYCDNHVRNNGLSGWCNDFVLNFWGKWCKGPWVLLSILARKCFSMMNMCI